MLSIQPPTSSSNPPSSQTPKFTANILPCRINHNGAVNASKRYWNVESDEKGRKVAYFRGRKLLGREVRIHKDYRGVVVRRTERVLPKTNGTKPGLRGIGPRGDEEEEEEEDEENRDAEEDVKILEEIGTFDEVMVWGHEQMPAGDDVFVRGIEEWIGFAEAMHSAGEERTSEEVKAKA